MEDEALQMESSVTGDARRLSTSEKRLLAALIAVVCLTVIIVYLPAISAKALCFDDQRYFVENPLVREPSLGSAWRFLTEVLDPSTVGGYYQPLTMISLMVDYSLVAPTNDITQFHRTSLALHVANTALIIMLLYLLFDQVWIAAAVGLLFGVHPLTVEPIPWVGERKTLLAAFFALWSLVLYVYFVRRGQRKFFIWSAAMYVLALMSKPTSTPLPVIMLLMDYWPLRRLKLATLREKVPFFVVGGISGIITYLSQSRTASVITPQQYGVMRVPLVICHNIIFYPFKMVWPVKLTPHYPFPEPLNLSQPMILIGVIGTCVLIFALLFSLRWTRAALTGWLVFFIMALPTMQALQFSDVIASDKFVYLPSIGVLMVLAVFLGWICGRGRRVVPLAVRCVAVAIIVLVLAGGEAVATRKYLVCWRDSLSLWKHMVEVTPNAVSPRNNLGVALAERGDAEGAVEQSGAVLRIKPSDRSIGIALAEKGDLDLAMEQFQQVLKIKPNDLDAILNIGNVLAREGQFAEAREYYEKMLQLNPGDADAYFALGVMLVDQGRLEEAVELYRGALEIRRGLEGQLLLHKGLGCVLLQMGQVDEAIKELEIAAKSRTDSGAYCNLGIAVASKGQMGKAMEYYKKAIWMAPDNAEAHYNLGNAYLSQGLRVGAIAEYREAIKVKPKYVKAYGNLAVALAQMGAIDEAIENFRRVVELEPNSPDVYFNLAGALADKGLVDEAIEDLRKAVELAPQDVGVRCMLADLLVRQGKVEQAIGEYEQGLKIDPANKDALAGLQKARDMQAGKGQPSPAAGGFLVNP